MPAFAAPLASKRKSDIPDDPFGRKRQALEHDVRPPQAGEGVRSSGEEYWMVQWRLQQQRKHKTWDGDGVLVVAAGSGHCRLLDLEGKPIGSGRVADVCDGATYLLNGKDIEIDRRIPREEYLSGACFGRGPAVVYPVAAPSTSGTLTKKFVPLKPMVLNPAVVKRPSTAASSSKVALEPVGLLASTENMPARASSSKSSGNDTYWTANWRKRQNRKHKTWDGDAFVLFDFNQGKLKLISEKGKILGTTSWKGVPLVSGYTDYIGGKEIELDTQIPTSQMPKITGSAVDPDAIAEENGEWEVVSASVTPVRHVTSIVPTSPANAPSTAKKFVTPVSFYGKAPEKPKPKGPLHDPNAEGAIVLKGPTKEHIKKFNKKDLPVVPVVLDPLLARKLRPHQVEGVKFMYECVMGLRKHEGQGCILADEMGLGKTLQTITLVWTLLKQNPYFGAGQVVGKALIVCPVSLVNNWKSEFYKWLGRDRVGIALGDKDKVIVKQFINSRDQVLIIGYEKLRTVIDQLAYCNPPIGLVICDEGHRLKSANNKTSKMFEALRTPRRIILSGTPIQNDLSEFHAMADFCNPGLLDDYATFKRVYETPILRSRAPECTSKEAEVGEARIGQLHATAKSFVLRREANILKNYLPPKTEYVVFITPTALQLSIFAKILRPDNVDNIVESSTAESLALIGLLTKISNSPILLKAVVDKAKNKAQTSKHKAVEDAANLLPERAQPEDVNLSGKLTMLANLLHTLRKDTEEKCVLVSHYTSTLNVIEAYCQKKGYTYFRLDGQTPPAKRQEYVNSFNKATQASRFLFLLSAKAGGVGLNLIGASRLCLIDSDWNPSHDLQSMARIHRDGQRRPVFIYRFLTTGAIDEKIFQRQVTKLGLSNSLMGSTGSSSKSDSFSKKDLRDIFSIHPDTACHTHDLLDCPCGTVGPPAEKEASKGDTSNDEDESEPEQGFTVASQLKPGQLDKMDQAYKKKKKAELAALGEWTHINCLQNQAREVVLDDVLRRLIYRPLSNGSDQAPLNPRVDSLLAATDLANILAMDTEIYEQHVHDLPAGSVSFLFERTSDEAQLQIEVEVEV